MGTVTLAEMRTNVGVLVQRTGIAPAILNRHINAALLEVVSLARFREYETSASFSTVAADYDYLIGSGASPGLDVSDFRALHEYGVWITTDDYERKLIPETRERFLRNLDDDSGSEGTPTHYHKFGTQLYLRPVPDKVYTILVHYWMTVTLLSGDGDVTALPAEFDEVIELGAAYRAHRDFREAVESIDKRNDFKELLRTRILESDLEEFPEGGISPVGPADTEEVLA